MRRKLLSLAVAGAILLTGCAKPTEKEQAIADSWRPKSIDYTVDGEKYYFEFDYENNLISKIVGTTSEVKDHTFKEYKYGINNICTEEYSDGKLILKQIIDEENNSLETYDYDSEDSVQHYKFEYEDIKADDLVVKNLMFYSEDEINSINRYEYDLEGKLVKVKNYDKDNELLLEIWYLQYESGNYDMVYRKNADDNLPEVESEFDDKGRLHKKIYHKSYYGMDEDGSSIAICIYYEYDDDCDRLLLSDNNFLYTKIYEENSEGEINVGMTGEYDPDNQVFTVNYDYQQVKWYLKKEEKGFNPIYKEEIEDGLVKNKMYFDYYDNGNIKKDDTYVVEENGIETLIWTQEYDKLGSPIHNINYTEGQETQGFSFNDYQNIIGLGVNIDMKKAEFSINIKDFSYIDFQLDNPTEIETDKNGYLVSIKGDNGSLYINY